MHFKRTKESNMTSCSSTLKRPFNLFTNDVHLPKGCKYYEDNNKGVTIINEAERKMYVTTLINPYIEEVSHPQGEVVKLFCIHNDYIITVSQSHPRYALVRPYVPTSSMSIKLANSCPASPRGSIGGEKSSGIFAAPSLPTRNISPVKLDNKVKNKMMVVELKEDIKQVVAYDNVAILVTEESFYYFLIQKNNKILLKKINHRVMTRIKYLNDCIVTMTLKKSSVIYDSFQIKDNKLELIQTIEIPVNSNRIYFNIFEISQKNWVIHCESTSKMANVFLVERANTKVEQISVTSSENYNIIVSNQLMLLVTFPIGILYEFIVNTDSYTINKVHIFKVYEIPEKSVQFNQNQFISMDTNQVMTIDMDIDMISRIYDPVDRCDFLYRHNVPNRLLLESVNDVFRSYDNSEIEISEVRRLFGILSNTNIISSALTSYTFVNKKVCSLLFELLCSCKKKLTSSFYCRLIECLIEEEQITRLITLLQSHAIPDDVNVALYLASKGEVCDFLLQFGLDMLKRMKKCDDVIFDVLLACGNYSVALMYAVEKNIKVNERSIKLIEEKIGNDPLYFQIVQFKQELK